MSDANLIQPIIDRRVNTPNSGGCAPCKHDADIATMKERDVNLIEKVNDVCVKLDLINGVIIKLPVVEERILKALETLAGQGGRLDVVEKQLLTLDREFDRFKTRILTIYAVFAFLVPAIGWGFSKLIDSIDNFREKTELAIQKHEKSIDDLKTWRLGDTFNQPFQRQVK